jgi:hypothetical protein
VFKPESRLLNLVRAFKGIRCQFEALVMAVYQLPEIRWIPAQKRCRNDDGAVVSDYADILGAIKYGQPL